MTSFADRPLEEQIAQWRAFVRRRHTLHGPDVEELEGHLRDQLVALTETGLVGDEAFLVAVKRMGNLDALSREFAREHSERLWKQLVMSPTPDAADDSPNTARAHTVVVLILTVTAALAVKIPDLLMRFFSEHPGITLVGANMVAMWLPFGAHFQEASGSCGYADRLGMPRNASNAPVTLFVRAVTRARPATCLTFAKAQY
jgi:hypothetical protein